MAKRLQHRGGTTSQHSTFTGAVREVTVDTDKNTLVVHDGATAGGHALPTITGTETLTNKTLTSPVFSGTATNFTSTGIDDNATSTAITINSSQHIELHGGQIESNNNTSSITYSGGNNSNAGANLTLFGGSHASTPNVARFRSSATEVMRIDSSGRVMIGGTTPDPSAKLTLEGGDLRFLTDDKGILWGNNEIKGNNASDFINITTAGTERMRIVSGGGVNVGSGVLSSASGDGNIVVDEGIYIGTFNGDNQIRSSSAGGGSATLYIGNAAIQVSSDRRLKTNIADTTMSAVDKIKQVRIVDFNWNDPSDTSYNNRNARGTWTGVIAQELIDVFPFAVNAPRNEEDLSIDTESEKKWQVDQAHLVPVLMKAIQEQQTKIEQLEARITTLENA